MTLCNDRGARQTERSPFFCLSELSHVGSGSADDCAMSWRRRRGTRPTCLSVSRPSTPAIQPAKTHSITLRPAASTWLLCLKPVSRAVDERPDHIFYCLLVPVLHKASYFINECVVHKKKKKVFPKYYLNILKTKINLLFKILECIL